MRANLVFARSHSGSAEVGFLAATPSADSIDAMHHGPYTPGLLLTGDIAPTRARSQDDDPPLQRADSQPSVPSPTQAAELVQPTLPPASPERSPSLAAVPSVLADAQHTPARQQAAMLDAATPRSRVLQEVQRIETRSAAAHTPSPVQQHSSPEPEANEAAVRPRNLAAVFDAAAAEQSAAASGLASWLRGLDERQSSDASAAYAEPAASLVSQQDYSLQVVDRPAASSPQPARHHHRVTFGHEVAGCGRVSAPSLTSWSEHSEQAGEGEYAGSPAASGSARRGLAHIRVAVTDPDRAMFADASWQVSPVAAPTRSVSSAHTAGLSNAGSRSSACMSLGGQCLSRHISTALSGMVSDAAGSELGSDAGDDVDSPETSASPDVLQPPGPQRTQSRFAAPQHRSIDAAAGALDTFPAASHALQDFGIQRTITAMASTAQAGVASTVQSAVSGFQVLRNLSQAAAATAPSKSSSGASSDVSQMSSVPTATGSCSSADQAGAPTAAAVDHSPADMPVKVLDWEIVQTLRTDSMPPVSDVGSVSASARTSTEPTACMSQGAFAPIQLPDALPKAEGSGSFFGEESLKIKAAPGRAATAADALWFGTDDSGPLVRFAEDSKQDDDASAAMSHAQRRRRRASRGANMLTSFSQRLPGFARIDDEQRRLLKKQAKAQQDAPQCAADVWCPPDKCLSKLILFVACIQERTQEGFDSL